MPSRATRFAILPLLLGILALALVTEASTDWLDLEPLRALSVHGQTGLLILGCVLIVWGLSGRPPIVGADETGDRQFRSWETPALLLIVLAAAVVRLWNLENTLPALVDELNFLTAVTRFVSDSTLRLVYPISDWAPFPWLYTVFQAIPVTLFGHDLAALRAASGIFGAIQVAAVYFLARELFDRRVAVLAALVLAFFSPHIHFSRLALNQAGDSLCGMLAVLFMVRGLRGGRGRDWALAGVCLGLTQYFYEAGRLFFPALALIWLVWQGITHPRWSTLRPLAGGAARMLIAGLLVAAPVYLTLLAHGRTITLRFSHENIVTSTWQPTLADGVQGEDLALLAGRLAQPVALLLATPESVGFPYYRGDQGLILLPFVPLFLIGLAVVLRRPRAPAFVLALWIVGVMLSNSLLIIFPGVTTRYVLILPALALLMALGMDRLSGFVAGGFAAPAARKILRYGLGAILSLVFAVVSVDHYFRVQLPDLIADIHAYLDFHDLYDVGLRAGRLPLGTQVVVVETRPSGITDVQDLLAYMQYDRHVNPIMTNLIELRRMALPDDRDLAFFVPPSESTILTYLYRQYPQSLAPSYSVNPVIAREQYVLITVPQRHDAGP
ncbi:MAG: glycosyltransferase family 39 protein [Chloroflexi bacterium]|nr:glycosyltransferase family 39 protein [Chloroflexota bacterium]